MRLQFHGYGILNSIHTGQNFQEPEKIDCRENPYHTWCLTFHGKECLKYEKVIEKPVKLHKDKQSLVDLHNNARIKVNFKVEIYIK